MRRYSSLYVADVVGFYTLYSRAVKREGKFDHGRNLNNLDHGDGDGDIDRGHPSIRVPSIRGLIEPQ